MIEKFKKNIIISVLFILTFYLTLISIAGLYGNEIVSKENTLGLSHRYFTIDVNEFTDKGLLLQDVINFQEDKILLVATMKDNDNLSALSIYDPMCILYRGSSKLINSEYRYFSMNDYINKSNVAVCNTKLDSLGSISTDSLADQYNVEKVIGEIYNVLQDMPLQFVYLNIFTQPVGNLDNLYFDFENDEARYEMIKKLEENKIEINYRDQPTVFITVLNAVDNGGLRMYEFGLILFLNPLYFLVLIIHSSHYKSAILVRKMVGANEKNIKKFIYSNILTNFIVSSIVVYLSYNLISAGYYSYYIQITNLYIKLFIVYFVLHVLLASSISSRYRGINNVSK